MYDLITIGGATLDTFVEIDEATLDCSNHKHGCLFCIPFGSKLPIKKFVQDVGGNAANVAVGASELGLKTAFYGTVSDDFAADEVLRRFKKHGVFQNLVTIEKDSHTNNSIIIDFKHDRTILSYHYPHKHSTKKLPESKWIYLTSTFSVTPNRSSVVPSLSSVISSEARDLAGGARSATTRVAFNPGTQELRKGTKWLSKIFKITDILFVNKQEAEMLVSKNVAQGQFRPDIKTLLKKLKSYGPNIVAITNGRDGAYAYDGTKFYKIGTLPVKIEEVTGAGDAFSSGFISGYFYSQDVARALKWGILNSQAVIQKIGAQNGLLSLREMRNWERKYRTLEAKRF